MDPGGSLELESEHAAKQGDCVYRGSADFVQLVLVHLLSQQLLRCVVGDCTRHADGRVCVFVF